jgi:hypothetical protein
VYLVGKQKGCHETQHQSCFGFKAKEPQIGQKKGGAFTVPGLPVRCAEVSGVRNWHIDHQAAMILFGSQGKGQ